MIPRLVRLAHEIRSDMEAFSPEHSFIDKVDINLWPVGMNANSLDPISLEGANELILTAITSKTDFSRTLRDGVSSRTLK